MEWFAFETQLHLLELNESLSVDLDKWLGYVILGQVRLGQLTEINVQKKFLL